MIGKAVLLRFQCNFEPQDLQFMVVRRFMTGGVKVKLIFYTRPTFVAVMRVV